MWKKIQDLFTKDSGKSFGAGLVVVAIDDEHTERVFINKTLTQQGFTVFTAADGESGFALIKEKRPDIVLLDYVMPGLNGREVCQRLKDDEELKDIPVVMLTGSVTPDRVVQAFEVGVEYYMAKPVDAKALIKQLRMVLREQKT